MTMAMKCEPMSLKVILIGCCREVEESCFCLRAASFYCVSSGLGKVVEMEMRFEFPWVGNYEYIEGVFSWTRWRE